MKPSILAALAIVLGFGTTAHSGCGASECPIDEQPASTQQAVEVTLERRIGDALKDLEIFNALAFKAGSQDRDATLERRIENALKDLEAATVLTFRADQKRLNELARKAGIER
jgi:hypothetical protein